jgi:hypothetical protein
MASAVVAGQFEFMANLWLAVTIRAGSGHDSLPGVQAAGLRRIQPPISAISAEIGIGASPDQRITAEAM